jgi:hypothetical protein
MVELTGIFWFEQGLLMGRGRGDAIEDDFAGLFAARVGEFPRFGRRQFSRHGVNKV